MSIAFDRSNGTLVCSDVFSGSVSLMMLDDSRRFPLSSQSSLSEESSIAEYFTGEAEDIICKKDPCFMKGILLGSYIHCTNSIILVILTSYLLTIYSTKTSAELDEIEL